MSDETNEEQKTSEEQEVKSDELAEDILDDASGGAVFAKYDGVDGEALDKDHKKWSDLASAPWSDTRSQLNEPDLGALSDDINIKR